MVGLLYAAGAIVAMYSEYDSATTLVWIALGLVVRAPATALEDVRVGGASSARLRALGASAQPIA